MGYNLLINGVYIGFITHLVNLYQLPGTSKPPCRTPLSTWSLSDRNAVGVGLRHFFGLETCREAFHRGTCQGLLGGGKKDPAKPRGSWDPKTRGVSEINKNHGGFWDFAWCKMKKNQSQRYVFHEFWYLSCHKKWKLPQFFFECMGKSGKSKMSKL